MRSGRLLLVFGGALLAAIALVVFVAQRPPTHQYPAPYIVARTTDVSGTPQPIQVVLQRGADRTLQRERSAFGPCAPGKMGCPTSNEVQSILVFLVRDESGALHAFIGEDPRNGCALEWMTIQVSPPNRVLNDAVFHDVCHGSIYDRRGQIVGGPSPWNLNALATEIRDGDVYIDPGRILVGDCPGCQGFQSSQGQSIGRIQWTPWLPIAVVALAALGPALLIWRRTGNRALGVSTAVLVLALASFALGTIATVAFVWGGILLFIALVGFGSAVATSRARRTR
jgi:hypothetical protein